MKHEQGQDRQDTAGGAGRYWRSLEQYAGTPEFKQWTQQEFPELATELDESYAQDGPSRRRFLQLMAASMALAGLTLAPGCRRKEQKVLPYTTKPAETIPGRPIYYATTMVLAGQPIGVLAETHEGRPTKIEGNPLHPASGGGTHLFAQASVLDLYDPDRSRRFLKQGKEVAAKGFWEELAKIAATAKANGGAGLAILSHDYASPAMTLLQRHIETVLPQSKFYLYEPTRPNHDQAKPVYDLAKARRILALDSDILGVEDNGVAYKQGFAQHRRAERPGDDMSRLYVVEPSLTATGAAADHHLRLPASAMAGVALAIAKRLVPTGNIPVKMSAPVELAAHEKWIAACADDLKAFAGNCVVVAGGRQSAVVHSLVAAINEALGNVGKTVWYAGPRPAGTIAQLAARLGQGQVQTLLILEGNPVFDAPADLHFAELVKKVGQSIRIGLYEDETSQSCTWHVPAQHYLERWGDALSDDGTLSPIQPMIEPLLGGVNVLEVLARLGGFETTDPYQIVRKSLAFIAGATEGELDDRWRKYLNEGVCATTASKLGVSPMLMEAMTSLPSAKMLEVCFATSSAVFDGRWANNAWMQECPEPISRLTWDNAAMISPKTAKELGLATGDVVKLEVGKAAVEIAVMVMPGQVEYSLTLTLGYGRTKAGSVGDGVGVDVYPLRTTAAMGFALGAKVTKTGKTHKLATTQEHWTISNHHLGEQAQRDRAIVREQTLEHFQNEPNFAAKMGVGSPTTQEIYAVPKFTGPQQWGMVVDLNACVGCGACVVACQAENNIPVVGKNEVLKGREMHWLRQDRYFTGEPEGEVSALIQPMACQHCQNAPCEPVCPVNATVHSPEGLNEMVYNRCIGTRYCSNNCPYKTRRFNFFDYNKGTLRQSKATGNGNTIPDPRAGFTQPQIFQPPMQELLKMQKNPQVTVRMRGVMEKCTYCVQRIAEAKAAAKVAVGQNAVEVDATGKGRANHSPAEAPAVMVVDGTIKPACQQVCPTHAIVFGDTADPSSQVSRLKKLSRNYQVIGHLNTKPRTSYLARLRNINPAIGAKMEFPIEHGGGEEAKA